MRERPTGERRARGAFTLFELVLVMALAGVLLTMALPRLAALRDRSSVRAAMTDLSSAFSLARRAAVAERTSVAVVLDTASGTVEVRAEGVAGVAGVRAGEGEGTERLTRRTLGATYGIVLGADRDSAVYDARGVGYGVSNLSVTARRGAIVDTLTMSRLGRVRW